MAWPQVTPLRIAGCLALLLSVARLGNFRPIELLDLRAYDYRLQQRGVGAVAPEVVVVAVDDESLARVGRWPWSRGVIADLIDRIAAGEPAVIGVDIIQAEATATCQLDAVSGAVDPACLNAVQTALHSAKSEDDRLTESVHSSGRTVLGYFFEFQNSDGAGIPAPEHESVYPVVKGSPAERLVRARAITRNLPALSAAARGLGYFNFLPDPDGLFRRAPLAIRFGDRVALPLSLAMLRVYWPDQLVRLNVDDLGVESVQIGTTVIPVAIDGQLLLNYRGPAKTIPHISAAEVLSGHIPPETFRGKLVLVGATAVGVGDVRATPVGAVFPGVEIHATVLDNILRRQFNYEPLAWADVALIVFLALALGLILQWIHGFAAVLCAAGLLGAYLVASQWVFVRSGLVLSTVYPALTVLLTYVAISLRQYIVTEQEKQRTRRTLELYLSPSLASYVSAHPDMLKLGGEKRERTVLFSDVRDFTRIAENLDPHDLVDLLNVYLGEMTDIVFAYEGMLDKYVGDGVMAVWGAPLAQDDHVARACRAALQMVHRLAELNESFAQRGWPRLGMRIGINSGEMVFGNMGSAGHLSLTVMGDNVNLGSRLEGINKLYGTAIIASEATIRAVANEVTARELDLVRVKGKLQTVRIFEILGPSSEQERWHTLIEHFHAGLAAYRSRQWDTAAAAFERALGARPNDGPSTLYLRRCGERRATPAPENWEPVTTFGEA